MTDQTEGRLTVEQSVKFAFEAMQVGAQIANSRKEQEMNEAKLGWFGRLLIKIALAKAVARGRSVVDITGLALSLKEAFAVTRAP